MRRKMRSTYQTRVLSLLALTYSYDIVLGATSVPPRLGQSSRSSSNGSPRQNASFKEDSGYWDRLLHEMESLSIPSVVPSLPPIPAPSRSPTGLPTATPTSSPIVTPTPAPIVTPTPAPTLTPTIPAETAMPTPVPTSAPTPAPTTTPTPAPTIASTPAPTLLPTPATTATPTPAPTATPTPAPTSTPIQGPTVTPTTPGPTVTPTPGPTAAPTGLPTATPTPGPTVVPTGLPTVTPTPGPTAAPTGLPTVTPTPGPTAAPAGIPTVTPTPGPTAAPTGLPTVTPTPGPTAAPTGLPTVTPTPGPTAAPTGIPTVTPTPGPTAAPIIVPTTKAPTPVPSTKAPTPVPTTKAPTPVPSTKAPTPVPTTAPTPVPTTAPTPVSTTAPTPVPTTAPTPVPTTAPTPVPTTAPTPVPTLSPTPAPTPAPTAAPSVAPSIAFSASPSTTPSAFPSPAPVCNVAIDIECTDSSGMPCQNLTCPTTVCEQRPSELTMLFNGGGCDQSFNIQPATLFQCFDFDNGPPTSGSVYIQALDSRGQGIVYFSGVVSVGETFTLKDNNGTEIATDTSILISDGTAPGGAPLQLVNFHTSCTQNLFLRDRYGASQVVEWTNGVQGTVNCSTSVVYNYLITNEGNVNTELVSLTSTINGDTTNFTQAVAGQDVASPNGTFNVAFQSTLDLTNVKTYTVSAEVVGETPGSGVLCTDSEQIQFDAGSPGPPVPPSPSPAPTRETDTVSPAPSSVPDTTPCNIAADVKCLLSNGAACSVLTTIPPDRLTCDVPPTQLGWIYRGDSCAESSTTQTFQCLDINGSPTSATVVYLTATGGDGVVYFNGTLRDNDPFTMQKADGSPLASTVSVSVRRNTRGGEALQQMIISISCSANDDLSLGKTFGANELGSYRNDDTFEQGFQEVEWNFSVENVGNSTVTVLTFGAIVNGMLIDLLAGVGNRPTLGAGDDTLVVVNSLVSLVQTDTYESTVSVGARAVGGLTCNATDSDSFTIS